MKILIILNAVLCALASDLHSSGWARQNIRSNNHISSSSSSSESEEQASNILKTRVYNPEQCHLVPVPTTEEINRFRQWTQKHNKHYPSEHEKLCRMINVVKKLRDIQAHNERFKAGKETFTRALNYLSDLTRQEMEANILIDDWNINSHYISYLENLPEPRESVDYRKENLVGPVGTQDNCGSSWTWSVAAVLESQLRKCRISEEAVSVQNILDCVEQYPKVCRGGSIFKALFHGTTGGILPARKYPYQETSNGCTYNETDIIGYVKEAFEYHSHRFTGFELIMRKLVSFVGPISTVLYADEKFENYKSGVFTSNDCSSTKRNHAGEHQKLSGKF
ncbi:hypothetical protein ACKWTF_014928 [Chironomus riparius]